MNAPLRDTRTLGQRRSDGRSFGPGSTPRRRRNRDFRPVLRMPWRKVFIGTLFIGVPLFAASPAGMAIFAAIWGSP